MAQKANVCRCCLTDGCYKDISTEYFWAGQKEVYASMLLDTFSIIISYQDGGGPSTGSRLICDACITQLRNAAAFKRQVIQSERDIVLYLQGKLKSCESAPAPANPVKLEPTETNSSDSEDFFADHMVSPTDCVDELAVLEAGVQKGEECSDLDLKDEISDGAMDGFDDEGELYTIKLRSDKKPTNFVKKSSAAKLPTKKKPTKKSTAIRLPTNKTLRERNSVTIRKKKSDGKKDPPKPTPAHSKATERRRRPIKTPLRELRLRENTAKLVLNSTMCLFKSLKVKYQCFYCKDDFLHMKELKAHSATHSDMDTKQTVVQRASFYKNSEITNLACSLCHADLNSIDTLQDHLSTVHEVAFHPEGHLLVPYRIEENLTCLFCNTSFKTFMRLLVHMNTHYANHVCESCGASFINRTSLRIHVASLHKEKKCTFCSATFESSSQKMKHIRKIHNSAQNYVRYCRLCEKTFKYTYLLVEHRIQEHGAASQTVSCSDCSKTFRNPNALKLHVRSVHVRERNHPCPHCAMRFFTSADRRRHERTHGVAECEMYACQFCNTKFKSKDSWRRHEKKQHPLFKERLRV